MEDLIGYFGSQKKLADALKVDRAAVSQWINAGHLPPLRAIQIEEMTNGDFKAIDLIRGDDE